VGQTEIEGCSRSTSGSRSLARETEKEEGGEKKNQTYGAGVPPSSEEQPGEKNSGSLRGMRHRLGGGERGVGSGTHFNAGYNALKNAQSRK